MSKHKSPAIVILPMETGKQIPACTDVEKTLISQILIDGEIIDKIHPILRTEMFYDDCMNKIYLSMLELFENGIGINMVTVIDKLRKLSFLDSIGGAYFIASLCNGISTSANYQYHVQIIHQTWLQRHILQESYKLYQMGYEPSNDVEDSKLFVDNLKLTLDYEVSTKSSNLYNETLISADEVIDNANFILKLRNSINAEEYVFNIISENSASCLFGGAGSRKSTFVSLISSIMSCGEDVGYMFAPNPIKCIIFDTEQSPYYAQKVLTRAISICGLGVTENLSLHCIKQYSIPIKKQIVEMAILKTKPKLIFLDNIRDFVYDILNFKECAELIQWLRYLQSKYELHTCLIIHRNKADGNARGHLGSEIINMCEAHIRIEKNPDNEFQSNIHFEKLRDNFAPPDEILEVDRENIPSFVRGLSNEEAKILFDKPKNIDFKKKSPF